MKINREYEVSNLAGSSKDGDTVYIDRRLPESLKLKNGKTINTDKYLIVHEVTEKIFENVMGYKYQYAHELATKMEREAVEKDGIPWDQYQTYMLRMVKKLHKINYEEPPDLDLEPEIDTHDKHELEVYHHWCRHDH